MLHQDYFSQPVELAHRKYEAIRAVIFDEQPPKDVAARFGIGYGTLRNWVGEFHRQREAGQPPPFSRPR